MAVKVSLNHGLKCPSLPMYQSKEDQEEFHHLKWFSALQNSTSTSSYSFYILRYTFWHCLSLKTQYVFIQKTSGIYEWCDSSFDVEFAQASFQWVALKHFQLYMSSASRIWFIYFPGAQYFLIDTKFTDIILVYFTNKTATTGYLTHEYCKEISV